MPLQVYNTLSRNKQPFEPIAPPRVGMYVCGPTVYGHSHLGHAKSYVGFDVIVRYLRHLGFDVTYVQNITDVGHLTDQDVGMADEGEDKLVAEAKRRGLHPMALAEIFTHSYLEDMDALNVRRPDIAPRATGHIPEQVALVQLLLDRGHAYEVDGNVYFDTSTFANYGRLSGRKLEDALGGARVAVRDDKRNATDFALWKRAAAGHIMRWPSPWGRRGRRGRSPPRPRRRRRAPPRRRGARSSPARRRPRRCPRRPPRRHGPPRSPRVAARPRSRRRAAPAPPTPRRS